MKKLIAILPVALMAIALVACGEEASGVPSNEKVDTMFKAVTENQYLNRPESGAVLHI